MRDQRVERFDQRVCCVERRPAVVPRVKIAFACAQRDMEGDDTTGRNVEGGHVATDHFGVEDDRYVRVARVLLEELNDRMPISLPIPALAPVINTVFVASVLIKVPLVFCRSSFRS
ncbi:MAG: hypothetical protein ACXVRS_00155 [Gaiellaceae bacterium]